MIRVQGEERQVNVVIGSVCAKGSEGFRSWLSLVWKGRMG